MLHNAEKFSNLIKTKAQKFGFMNCGISKAEFLEEDAKPLENFLKNNYHGEMSYMENYFDKRLNPTLLVEGSKSVISLSYNYFPKEKISELENFKISKYFSIVLLLFFIFSDEIVYFFRKKELYWFENIDFSGWTKDFLEFIISEK